MLTDYHRCAELVAQADGLLITAGAGLGVDSGLPDFRGGQGFWRAYPALGRQGLRFEQIASPAAFTEHPRQAWGFYGHRLALYRRTEPHEGFHILRRLGERMAKGYFVFTSNVDGQFQKAGFDAKRLYECHGSIHHLQCMDGCAAEIWPAGAFHPTLDEENCQLTSAFPRCPHCGGLARPNILLFGDGGWLERRSAAQSWRLRDWLGGVERPLVIEVGAGTAIPTVRRLSESLPGWLIRINSREAGLNGVRGVAIPRSGLEALRGIEAAMQQEREGHGT